MTQHSPGPSDLLQVNTTLELSPSKQSEAILFCGSAQRLDGDKIGWLPWQSYTEAHSRGHLLTLQRNDDFLGFILAATNQQRECKIYQCWVRPDARMIEHGRALAAFCENRVASPSKCWCIRAWVASDLAANFFWRAIGFQPISWRHGSEKKSRRHILWRRPVIKTLSSHLSREIIVPA